MKKIYGTGASAGVAMGFLRLLRSEERKAEKRHVKDTGKELARLQTAQSEAAEKVNEIYLRSLKQIGEKDSMIFQIQIMMLQDEDFVNTIYKRIEKEHVNAEYAVQQAGREFADRFVHMDDEYMRARSADVVDISRRLIQCLDKTDGKAVWQCAEPSVLAAEELTPSETMQFDKSKILALITRGGSSISHVAILARTMGIPSVVALKNGYDDLEDGMFAIVDGTSGKVILEPDESTKKHYETSARKDFLNRQNLKDLLKSRTVVKGGKRVEINANIASPEDADAALENGADGIGLFRSEFLYMRRDRLPSEEEQFQSYVTVLKKMGPRPVIVRTFDIGADKQIAYLNLPAEANPAMGYRAIRVCLDREDLFRTQLRALLRASAFGNLKIMFPMITSPKEVRAAKDILEQVKKELGSEGIKFSPDIKVGIMIETPAAVMLGEELARICDFFSVGTNDLTQYTLAVDRINDKVSYLYDQSHPAVLKLIRLAAESAHGAGIPIGICGESAANTGLMKFYLDIGIDELSVAPSSVLEMKRAILEREKG